MEAKETGITKIDRTLVSENAPLSHYVIVGVTILLGPISGGILTYISLKKIGSELTKYVLPTTFAISFILSYLLMVPLAEVDINGYFVQAPVAAILVAFQYKAVEKWAKENPQVKFRNKIGIDLLWSLLGLLIFFLIAFIVAIFTV